MQFFRPHPLQVKKLMTDDRSAVENLVELSQLEKQHLVEVLLLYLPVLNHCGCEQVPLVIRNVQRPLVVLWVLWSPQLRVPHHIRFDEVRQGFQLFFLSCECALCLIISDFRLGFFRFSEDLFKILRSF